MFLNDRVGENDMAPKKMMMMIYDDWLMMICIGWLIGDWLMIMMMIDIW